MIKKPLNVRLGSITKSLNHSITRTLVVLEAALGPAWLFTSSAAAGRFFVAVFGTGPEDDEDFADLLYRARIERTADFVNHGLALEPVIAQHPDLDQFVAFEIDVDFIEHCRRESGVADHNDWLQMVGAGTQRAAFSGFQDFHSVSLAYGTNQNQQSVDA